jgi:GTP-binding protein
VIKIRDAFLLTSSHNLTQLPEDLLPEIAVVGRSNVGKSSLLNSLLQRRLARTSNTPGKTRLLNFFVVRGFREFPAVEASEDQPALPLEKQDFELTLVDLPGYGYAKISQSERAHWGETLRKFLSGRRNLKQILHLVDIRHGMLDSVCQVQSWLQESQLPTTLVLTKTDKLSRSKAAQEVQKLRNELGLPVIAFSSEDKQLGPTLGGSPAGRDALWDCVYQGCCG